MMNMDDVEGTVRRIVASSDINIVTKRMVRRKYQELKGGEALSPAEEQAVNSVLKSIIMELAKKVDLLSMTSSTTCSDSKLCKVEGTKSTDKRQPKDGEENLLVNSVNTASQMRPSRENPLQLSEQARPVKEVEMETDICILENEISEAVHSNSDQGPNFPKKGTHGDRVLEKSKSFVMTHSNMDGNIRTAGKAKKPAGKKTKSKFLSTSEAVIAVMDSSESDFAETPQKRRPSCIDDKSPLVKDYSASEHNSTTQGGVTICDKEGTTKDLEHGNFSVHKHVKRSTQFRESADGETFMSNRNRLRPSHDRLSKCNKGNRSVQAFLEDLTSQGFIVHTVADPSAEDCSQSLNGPREDDGTIQHGGTELDIAVLTHSSEKNAMKKKATQKIEDAEKGLKIGPQSKLCDYEIDSQYPECEGEDMMKSNIHSLHDVDAAESASFVDKNDSENSKEKDSTENKWQLKCKKDSGGKLLSKERVGNVSCGDDYKASKRAVDHRSDQHFSQNQKRGCHVLESSSDTESEKVESVHHFPGSEDGSLSDEVTKKVCHLQRRKRKSRHGKTPVSIRNSLRPCHDQLSNCIKDHRSAQVLLEDLASQGFIIHTVADSSDEDCFQSLNSYQSESDGTIQDGHRKVWDRDHCEQNSGSAPVTLSGKKYWTRKKINQSIANHRKGLKIDSLNKVCDNEMDSQYSSHESEEMVKNKCFLHEVDHTEPVSLLHENDSDRCNEKDPKETKRQPKCKKNFEHSLLLKDQTNDIHADDDVCMTSKKTKDHKSGQLFTKRQKRGCLVLESSSDTETEKLESAHNLPRSDRESMSGKVLEKIQLLQRQKRKSLVFESSSDGEMESSDIQKYSDSKEIVKKRNLILRSVKPQVERKESLTAESENHDSPEYMIDNEAKDDATHININTPMRSGHDKKRVQEKQIEVILITSGSESSCLEPGYDEMYFQTKDTVKNRKLKSRQNCLTKIAEESDSDYGNAFSFSSSSRGTSLYRSKRCGRDSEVTIKTIAMDDDGIENIKAVSANTGHNARNENMSVSKKKRAKLQSVSKMKTFNEKATVKIVECDETVELNSSSDSEHSQRKNFQEDPDTNTTGQMGKNVRSKQKLPKSLNSAFHGTETDSQTGVIDISDGFRQEVTVIETTDLQGCRRQKPDIGLKRIVSFEQIETSASEQGEKLHSYGKYSFSSPSHTEDDDGDNKTASTLRRKVVSMTSQREANTEIISSDVSDWSPPESPQPSRPRKKRTVQRKIQESAQGSSGELKRLRKICHTVGLVLRNTKELAGCTSDEDKIIRIKQLLKDKGMKGMPSLKKAEQLNLQKEVRELQSSEVTSNTADYGGTRRRGRENVESEAHDVSQKILVKSLFKGSHSLFSGLKSIVTDSP